jgi:protein-tyrosine-phosphatase
VRDDREPHLARTVRDAPWFAQGSYPDLHHFVAGPSRTLLGMASVLFVCLHNAGRSQMSEALFRRAAKGRHDAASAGTEPAERVHPEVVEGMRELGIDLESRAPQRLTRELAEAADVVVTMGCGDACPYIPGKEYRDWELPDPKGRPLAEVRALRDEIARRVDDLVAELERRAA